MHRKSNQNGFTVIDRLLVAILIVVILGAVFLAYRSSQSHTVVTSTPTPITKAPATVAEARTQIEVFYDSYRAHSVDTKAQQLSTNAYDNQTQALLSKYLVPSLAAKIGHVASYDYVLCSGQTINTLFYSEPGMVTDKTIAMSVTGHNGSYVSQANVTVRRSDLLITAIDCPQN